MALAQATVVFAEIDIQDPVQRSFDAPMIAYGAGKLFDAGRQARDEHARLDARFLVSLLPLAVDQPNAAQVLPFRVTRCQVLGNFDPMVNPRFDTAMAVFF